MLQVRCQFYFIQIEIASEDIALHSIAENFIKCSTRIAHVHLLKTSYFILTNRQILHIGDPYQSFQMAELRSDQAQKFDRSQ